MAIRFGEMWDFQWLAEQTGEELLELWLKVGSMTKAISHYNSDHPDHKIKYGNELSRRVRVWMVLHVPEAIKLIQIYNPTIPVEAIQGKILYYAVRVFKYKRFLSWADKNPWVKEYEADYNKWYGQNG